MHDDAHNSHHALALAIGARVKRERLARHWTLDHLADVSGVSRRMLVNVEQGAVNPSIGTLLRISDALGIGLPTLVEPPQPGPVKVTRRGEGAVLWRSDGGGRGELVAATGPPDVVELWDWTLAPGDLHESEAHTPGTRELIQVTSGTLTVRVADQEISLNTGDAIAFPGDVEHRYANVGESRATFVMTVYEPRVGLTSRLEERHAGS